MLAGLCKIHEFHWRVSLRWWTPHRCGSPIIRSSLFVWKVILSFGPSIWPSMYMLRVATRFDLVWRGGKKPYLGLRVWKLRCDRPLSVFFVIWLSEVSTILGFQYDSVGEVLSVLWVDLCGVVWGLGCRFCRITFVESFFLAPARRSPFEHPCRDPFSRPFGCDLVGVTVAKCKRLAVGLGLCEPKMVPICVLKSLKPLKIMF